MSLQLNLTNTSSVEKPKKRKLEKVSDEFDADPETASRSSEKKKAKKSHQKGC
jgi:hypothetical protein